MSASGWILMRLIKSLWHVVLSCVLKSAMMTSLQLPQPIAELSTPCLLMDVDIVRRNAESMRERCNSLGLKLRPHMKTHKCLWVIDAVIFRCYSFFCYFWGSGCHLKNDSFLPLDVIPANKCGHGSCNCSTCMHLNVCSFCSACISELFSQWISVIYLINL